MKGMRRPLVLATELGVTMGLMTVVTVLVGLFLGSWLDRQLGTRPIATLVFILLGVLSGFLGTLNLARSAARELNAAAAARVEPRRAFSGRALGRALLLVLQLVLVTLVPVMLSLWLGHLLDRTLGRTPLFTIVLAMVSVIGSLLGVYFITVRATRYTQHNSQEAA